MTDREAPAKGRARSTTRQRGPAGHGASRRRREPATARTRGAAALRRTTVGQRPFLAALVLLAVLVFAMALGPLQRYTAAAERVETLEATRQQLSEQVERLEERRATLEDPEEVELIARTELGLVKPGEVPFIVVSPDDDRAPVTAEDDEQMADDDAPWYRRIGRRIGERFGAEG
jgi:cell division protein FtsB